MGVLSDPGRTPSEEACTRRTRAIRSSSESSECSVRAKRLVQKTSPIDTIPMEPIGRLEDLVGDLATDGGEEQVDEHVAVPGRSLSGDA